VSEFEADTALEAVEGGFAGEITARWNVGGNPNGGYLMALAARAMLAASRRADPLSVTAHYVTAPVPGPVIVRTETARAGRRYSTVAATVAQDGHQRLRVLGALGELDRMQGPTRLAGSPPRIPPPEECVPLLQASERSGSWVPEVMNRYDLRLAPDDLWIDSGAPGVVDEAPLTVTGWIRFADGTEPSTLSLLAFSDAFPPTVLNALDVGWVPTVELTVHVRGRPAPGWVLGTFRTRFLVDGLLEEDGELWGEDGRLLALARQLALVLPRR